MEHKTISKKNFVISSTIVFFRLFIVYITKTAYQYYNCDKRDKLKTPVPLNIQPRKPNRNEYRLYFSIQKKKNV